MSEVAVRVEGLGKRYRLGGPAGRCSTLRESLASLASTPFKALRSNGERSKPNPPFWALKEVSFEVRCGEVVGIIGRNGAGKSTLLKILSRITEPTEGAVDINGRVGSLLEVGTGFHPELTGRENVYLNGAILGMQRAEIARKFDEIAAFAEVEKFIDTPVKHYSSGMYMRLAFSVAAHLEPEILIVDEVLAVGDVAFQQKCLGKMGDVARDGRTVVFVSHNMAAVEQLTHRCVLLERGCLSFDGSPCESIRRYMSGVTSTNADEDVERARRVSPLGQEVQFIRARVDHPNGVVPSGDVLRLHFRLRANASVSRFTLGGTVFRIDGIPVGSWFTEHAGGLPKGEEAEYTVHASGLSLAPGKYYLGASTGRGDHLTGRVDFDVIFNVLNFEVRPPEGDGGTVAQWPYVWGPIVFPPPTIRRVD